MNGSDSKEAIGGDGSSSASLDDNEKSEHGSLDDPKDGVQGADNGSGEIVEVLGDNNSEVLRADIPDHTTDSSDTVDVDLVSEKGTFFWITIGVTYSHVALTGDGQKIPQWGVGIFFDHNYIPLRFKDPVRNAQGIYYRPEMRFWSQEDAKAFALSVAAKFRFKMDPNVFGSATIPEAAIDPISQALEYVRDEGMKVNNLFQHADGTWRCSMKQENYFDFADGQSAVEAIEGAMHNTKVMSQLSYSAAKKKRK